MTKDLGNLRKSYEKDSLNEADVPETPMELFQSWFSDAQDHPGIEEANAMSLATVAPDGFPRTRIVLLKQFSREGFQFFTNYESEKGKAMAANPKVCLSFFWPALERQVIISGEAQPISAEDSDRYFQSRPRGSRLGAIASDQSTVIPNREYLEEKISALESRFEGMEIPRPAHWGGYQVAPREFEFWQGRQNRLHDRIRYRASGESRWIVERLSP